MPDNISFYNSLPAKGQPQISSGTMSINDFLWAIKAGKWRQEVEAIRATEDKEKRNALKKRLVSFTVSGVFNERKEQNLIEHSGFICIDIDNYTDKSHIETDPYTYAAAYSASGNGFFVIVKIDPKKHKESFGWLRKYYYETYGIVVDNAPQNVASLRYASYDPNFEIIEKSKVSKTLAKEFKKQKGGLPIVVTGERVEEYVNEAYSRGLNIAEGYDEYLNLSFALANGFGANGRSYFHKLASISPKYKEQQADRQFDIALARNMPGITVGTFWYMLKMAGINIKAEDNNAVVVAAMGKKAGKTQEVLVNQLVTVNHIPEQQAKQLVQQVYEREDISLQTIAYDPEKLIETLKQFIESNYSLRRNSITKIIEDNGKEWSDEKMNTMFIKARAVFNSPSVTHDLCQRMIHSEFTPDFNPITEYIEKNRWRKSTGNIAALCATIQSNTPMKDIFIRKWCLSILAAYSGIAVRSVLTLVGGQRSGKCLAKGTLVMLSDGTSKAVELIESGEKLMGLNGSHRTVLSTCMGSEKMYKIKQQNGDIYTVNESHILSLKNRITKKTLNISVKDFVTRFGYSSSKFKGYKSSLIINKDVDLPIEPYLLGIWLGDGQSDVSSGVRVESMDDEIINYLQNYCNKNNLFLSKYKNKKSKSNCYNIVGSLIKGGGKKDKKNLKNVFVTNNLSKNKHIPLCYKTSSTKQRLELLAGLIDTDGSYDIKNSYEITQVKKQLSDDILFIIRSLGFKGTQKVKVINGKNYYRITFSGNLKLIPCKIERKKALRNAKYDASLTSIFVEPLGVDNYYGFEIDGDRLFLLSDFTVTHNTQWFRRLLPNDLKRYYGESKLDAGKDDYLLMCTKLILMNDEFGGKSKHDEKLFKELTSKEVFSLRAPYGRSNADYYRLALLAGTSNDLDIMQDPTGNTRVLPVEVIKIDHKAYNEIDKDELFMELVRAYEAGEDWDFTNEEFEGLANLSKDYEGINYERECILQHFEESNEVGGIVEEMTAVQIKDYIETNGRQQLRNLKALGMQLRLLYGINKMKRGSGKVYRVIKRNSNNSTIVGHNTGTTVNETPAQQPTTDIYRDVSDNDDLPF